jgi:hypothetical protein
LRPVRPDRALDMAGHCLEAHVAAASRVDRGDNHDPAVGAASAKEALTREAAIRQPLRQDDEAARAFGAADDVQPPSAAAPCCTGGTRTLVPGISEDGEDEGEQRPRSAVEHQSRAVAVLQVGRVHDDRQQQSERVDEDVVLDPFDLLARIEPDRVDRRPPFSAALTDLLSRMAAVGLASLPARSRQAT